MLVNCYGQHIAPIPNLPPVDHRVAFSLYAAVLILVAVGLVLRACPSVLIFPVRPAVVLVHHIVVLVLNIRPSY
jgi:hypothetical protein